MLKKLEEQISKQVGEAIHGAFQDQLVYGAGYIKVSTDANGIVNVTHIPFVDVPAELDEVLSVKRTIS